MPEAALAASAKLYRPKLATTLVEGYGLADLRHDAMAGLTVAIVALPLSMAIAMASGVSPDRGLYAAIVGGFLVSALGGSRFQIGGPAGAFIVLVAATVAKFGVDGLLLAVLLSGAMLTLLGLLRLGSLIRHIPHAVTVGFTAAIAVTILASQLKDLFGLRLAGPEPGPVVPKLAALANAAPTASAAAFGVALGVIAIALAIRRLKPLWPSMLVAVAAASAVAALGHLPVETIGSRFGGIPHGLPAPHLPPITAAKLLAILPTALSFTLLGGIESLLSAVVADGMTGRRHRSNMELTAQGLANMASAMFGGIAVTGTIARTATNVRAGARSPVAGMLHAAFLLAFMLLAAPLASYVPVSALAGVLVVVAWNMTEKGEIARLLRSPQTGLVLAATFVLTVLRDLTSGILAGCLLAALLWLAPWLTARIRALFKPA
jgi:SulP family sulfate permease